MSVTRRALTHLFSPAMVVALLALLVASTTSVWAAAKITGADIKNGTVTTKDIANRSLNGGDVRDGSIGSKDLSFDAHGARAVATLWGSTDGTCHVVAGLSRGVASTCTRVSAGYYRVQLSPSVLLARTFPVCSMAGRGGFKTDEIRTCNVDIVDDDTLRVRVGVWSSGTHTPADVPQRLPTVLVLP